MFSYYHRGKRLWIRLISATVAIFFLWYDVTWAGSVSGDGDRSSSSSNLTSNIDSDQSQRFLPYYVKIRTDVHKNKMNVKNDIETTDYLREGVSRTDETVSLKRPRSTVATKAVRTKVSKGNNIPVAYSQSVTLQENGQTTIQLQGTDADGNALVFKIASIPLHGTLTALPETPGQYIYTPSESFTGTDYFTYVVNDGKVTSKQAIVFLTVESMNNAPIANPLVVQILSEDGSKDMVLGGTDDDGDLLSYIVESGPLHGTLVSDPNDTTGTRYTYTPTNGYSGADSFTFKVSDGKAYSDVATVNLVINPINYPPVLVVPNVPDTIIIGEETSFTLSATDADSPTIAYILIGDMPEGASLNSATGVFTWTPQATGEYTFKFRANDDKGDVSNIIDVVISVIEDPVEVTRRGMLDNVNSEISAVVQEIANLEAALAQTEIEVSAAQSQASENIETAAAAIDGLISYLVGISNNLKLTEATKLSIASYIGEATSAISDMDAKEAEYLKCLSDKALLGIQGRLGALRVYLGDLNSYKLQVQSAADIDSLTGLELPTQIMLNQPLIQPVKDPSLALNAIVDTGLQIKDIADIEINTNYPPVLAIPDAPDTIIIGEEITFTLSASDVDSSTITYQLTGLPEDATFNANTGVFTWTPSQAGEYTLSFTATDDANGISNIIDIIINTIEDPVEVLRGEIVSRIDSEITLLTQEIAQLQAQLAAVQASIDAAKALASQDIDTAVTTVNAISAYLEEITNNPKLSVATKASITAYIEEVSLVVSSVDDKKTAYINSLDAPLAQIRDDIRGAELYLGALNSYKISVIAATGAESLEELEIGFPRRIDVHSAIMPPGGEDPRIVLNDLIARGNAIKDIAIAEISVNYPPVLAMPEAPDTAIIGKEITFTLSASDIDSDNITYQLVGDMPEGGSLNQNTGLFTWTPRIIGEYTLQFTASDGNGASNTVYVLIKAIEDPVEVLRGNIITHIDSEITLVTQEIADLEAVIAQAQADLETARAAISLDINDSVLIINTILAYLNEIKENPKLSAATKADMLSYVEEASLVVSSDDIGSAYLQSLEAPISGMRDQLSAANSYLAALNGYKASVNSASDTDALEALNAVFPERTQPDRPRTVLIEDPRVMLNDLISRGSAIRDIAIAEMSVNYPPILDMPYLPDTVIAGKALTFILSASDIDSSDIAYSLIGEMPEGATLDPVTGAFTWTPKAAGEYAFKFRATDGQAVSNTVAIVISVIADPVEVARTGLLDKTEYEKNLTAQAISDLETRLAQAVADAAAAKAKASEDIAAAEGILSGIVNLLTEDRENPELSDATRSELEAYLAETSSYISGLNALVEAYAGWLDTESIEIDKVLGAEKIYFGDLIDYEDRVNVATELYELKALGFEFPVKMVPNIMPEMPVDDPRIAMNDMISRGNAIAAKVEAEIAENRPPVALAIVVPGFNEDSAQTITLSGTDIDGDTLTYTIVSQPAHGTASISGNTLTYTPQANYNGTDSFTYKVNDGTADSEAATVNLTINAVVDAPLIDAANKKVTAASVSYEDVKAAVDAAASGDTVYIPAGEAVWLKSASTVAITISKSITLKGVEGLTVIRNGNADGTNAFNALIKIDLTADEPVRITGIYFDNRINPNYGHVAGWSGNKSAVLIKGRTYTGVGVALTQIRIDNCTFEKGLRAVAWSGWAYGVVDDNTFINCDIGVGLTGDNNFSWERPIVPGTADTVFIEDNVFIINNDNSYDPNEQIYHQEGARSVVRNNLFDGSAYTNGNSLFYDSHGNQNIYNGDTHHDFRAQPLTEVYDNVFIAYKTYSFMNSRGGSRILFNNTFTLLNGSANVFKLTDEESWQTLFFDTPDTAWAAEDQINNSFFWNNTINGRPLTVTFTKESDKVFIQEGRDYWMHAPDATSGKTVWGHYDENGQLVYDRPGSANMVFIAGPSAYYNPAADPSIGYIPYGVLGEDGNYHHPLTLQPNSPPVAAMITVPEFGEDTTQAITLAGTDVDNNPLTYIVVSQPQHGTLTVDPNDPAKYIYKPDRNYNGPDSFVYKVNDGTIDSEQVTVELTVNPVNDIPVFVPIPDNTIYFVVRPGDENVILQYQLVGQDVDRDQIQYSIINAPSFVALDENTGLLTATLSYSDLGKIQDNVTITVSEKPLAGKEFLSVTKTLSIKVREPRILYTASDGTDTGSGEIGQPISLGRANLTALPGDTVYIRGGTYYVGEPMNYPGGDLDHQGINPKYSGMEGSPITYCNYGDEVVNFVGTSDHSFAVNLNCDFNPNPVPMRSYIVVKGLNFSNFSKFLWIVNSSHNEVANCKFQKMYERADGTLPVWQGSTIYRNSQYNYIHDCVFSDYGYQIPDNDGVVFELGNENAYDDFTSYNRIENNEMYHGGHHVIGIHGCYNVVRNNYFHNDAWDKDESGTAWGYRVVYMNGRPTCSHSNLLEGNRIAYGRESYSTYHSGGGGLKISSADNIIRNNMIYDNALNGILLMRYPGGEVDSNHIYSNVIYHNGYYADTTKNSYSEYLTHAIAISGTSSVVETYLRDNVFKNNIFSSNNNLYNPDQPIVAYSQPGYFPTYQIIENNWNEGLSGDPLFVYNGTALDPFGPQPDFRLQSGSGAIDAGGWLTTITSASGSGTTFTVLDAKHFMDGWKVIEGDLIQLEGQKTPVRIISVNYETNAITVDAPLIWVSGQGVGMAYSGDRPDIGAYEYIEVNTPPVATAPVVPSFNEDTPQEITLSATDADNNPLTYTIVSQPSHGMLVADPDNAGKYIYTPDPDYNGEDSFTYIANDGTADSEIATVNLTIAGVNDTPVLVQPAALTGAEDSAITGSLSGTATDADGNPLTFVLVSGPFHGTLTLNADGTYAYTPAANYNGTDSFTYKVNDGTADSEAATVDLTINAVVDAPLIDAANKKVTAASVSYEDVKAAVDAAVSGDTVIVPEGAAVWAKQLDITKGIIFSGSGIDATTITGNVGPTIFLIRYAPSDPSKNEPFRLTGFTFDLNNDSKALSVYNPTEPSISNVRIDHNYFLNCAMPSIQIKGAYGVMDHNKLTGAVHIDVYGNNASSWDNSTFEFGTSDSFFIEYNEIICEETPHSCGAGGRYVIRYNTYTHTGNEGLYPWFDMHGNMGTGGNWSTMGAEIYGNTLIHEYPTAGVRVFDQRGGQAIIFDNEVISTSSCTGRAREEKSDSLNPTTNSQPQHVSNSYYWNNTWGSPSANKLINTYAENVAGVAYSITENVDFFDQDLSFDGTAGVGVGTIADMNLITPQLEGVGYWATDAEGQSALYKATRNGAGVLAWELYYRPYGVLGEDGKYHHPLTLPPNTPPVATAPVVPSFNEDTPQEITLSATDADNNPLTYTIVSQPSHGMLVADPDNAGKYIYTPDPDYNGEDSFTYIANDGTADSEPVNIALTIVGVNDTPILNNIIGQTGIVGQELSFTLSSTDVDSNSLTYQIVDFVPEGATLDPVTGVFSWTPTAAGNYQLKFIATDGDKTSEALIVNLRVDL